MSFNQNSLKTLHSITEGTVDADAYKQFVLLPFVELVDRFIPLIQKADDKIVIRKNLIQRARSVPFIGFPDTLKTIFRRDSHAYPIYPRFILKLSPWDFTMSVGFSTMTREMMDILRSMVIGNAPIFQEAWQALNTQKNFHIEGPAYKGSRFKVYQKEIQRLLDSRCVTFSVHETKLSIMLENTFVKNTLAQFISMIPVYKMLQTVTKSGYQFNQEVFDPWNIRQPADEQK